MSTLMALQTELQQLANLEQQKILQRFFKTGRGEYGEGDTFLGIKVPILRKVAKRYRTLSLTELQTLLSSHIHEHRFIALILLIHHYTHTDTQPTIFDFYRQNINYINNWDLVDISAPKIIGDYLQDKSRDLLYQLAQSNNLWHRRIAILATLTFIKNNEFQDTLQLAEKLLHDQQDLIHKAVGWMLREVGKRNQALVETFLNQYYQTMPRTMLRYAIEKFDQEKRQWYLNK